MAKSISYRINSLIIILLSVVVFGCLSILIIRTNSIERFSSEELEKSAKKDVAQIAKMVYDLTDNSNNLAQKMLNVALNTAREVIRQKGAIKISGTEQWQAINQFTNEAMEVNAPKLEIGGITFPKIKTFDVKVPIVDEVGNLSGATVTIFVKMNSAGDMLRIATTVKNKKGERAIGTFIPVKEPDGKENPVVSSILQGKDYIGRAFVVDQWYVTAYSPLRLPSGEIVGMVYVGIPQKTVEESLRKAIYSIKIGETGYVYVLGGSGKQKGHYIISKDGKRDGENIWESKDANGKLFIQEIINATTENPGEVKFFRYDWKNVGEDKARTKIVAAVYYKDWDWVIGAGSYEDEIYAVRDQISKSLYSLLYIMVILSVIIYVIAIIISTRIAKRISGPITNAAMIAQYIGRGDLDSARKLLD
jgi:hypothetical protein